MLIVQSQSHMGFLHVLTLFLLGTTTIANASCHHNPPPKKAHHSPPPRKIHPRSPPPVKKTTVNFQSTASLAFYSTLTAAAHDVEELVTTLECPLSDSFDTGILDVDTNKTITVPTVSKNCTLPPLHVTTGADTETLQAVGFNNSGPLATGDIVDISLQIDKTQARVGRHLLATPPISIKNLVVKSRTKAKEIYTGTPIPMRSITVIMNICGSIGNFKTPASFNNIHSAIKNMYTTCSYNRVSWNDNENIVLGPVALPCGGNYTRGTLTFSWTSTGCGASEQYIWSTYVDAYIREIATTNVDVAKIMSSNHYRLIHLLPKTPRCTWAGIAAVGCSGVRCSSYIHGKWANNARIHFHELQHNMGLGHATVLRNEYGDRSDPQGDMSKIKSGIVCHNAPYMYRLGWANPIANLTMADFSGIENKRSYVLPNTGANPVNFISVNLGMMKDVKVYNETTWFFSYRVKNASGYDSALISELNNKVSLHTFNGFQSERDYNRSALISFMGVNQTYTVVSSRNTSLVLKVTSLSTQFANLNMCIKRIDHESIDDFTCFDGIDNDCDGLVDFDDPDCAT